MGVEDSVRAIAADRIFNCLCLCVGILCLLTQHYSNVQIRDNMGHMMIEGRQSSDGEPFMMPLGGMLDEPRCSGAR